MLFDTRRELSEKLGDLVHAARFRGDGCAICLAAASILTELIGGADITNGEIISSEELLSSLKSDIKRARMKCALLPLEVLREGVKIHRQREPAKR